MANVTCAGANFWIEMGRWRIPGLCGTGHIYMKMNSITIPINYYRTTLMSMVILMIYSLTLRINGEFGYFIASIVRINDAFYDLQWWSLLWIVTLNSETLWNWRDKVGQGLDTLMITEQISRWEISSDMWKMNSFLEGLNHWTSVMRESYWIH